MEGKEAWRHLCSIFVRIAQETPLSMENFRVLIGFGKGVMRSLFGCMLLVRSGPHVTCTVNKASNRSILMNRPADLQVEMAACVMALAEGLGTIEH